MNAVGDMIKFVVPSRQGVLSFSSTCPATLAAPSTSPAMRSGDSLRLTGYRLDGTFGLGRGTMGRSVV